MQTSLPGVSCQTPLTAGGIAVSLVKVIIITIAVILSLLLFGRFLF